MDTFLSRNRNSAALAALLMAQLIALGYQVRRPDAGGVRMVQMWGTEAVLPMERATERVAGASRNLVRNYIALRAVRARNEQLQQQVANQQLEIQNLRLAVRELPRLDALLEFQRSFGVRTVAAQIIGSGATPDAQVEYLDRGANAGLARNMAVITPDGLVGKISLAGGTSATLLLISDPESGVGVSVGDAGVLGVLRGEGSGRTEVRYVPNDEPIAPGAEITTSGQDQVFPKGLRVGTVVSARRGVNSQTIAVKLATDLSRLGEVLVITATLPAPVQQGAQGAQGLTSAEIRQALLPTIPVNGVTMPPAPAAPAAAAHGDTPPLEGDAAGLPPAAVKPSTSGTIPHR